MITPDQVLIMVQPVDMRLGLDALSSLVQQALGKTACDGRVYLFRNKTGNRIKALCWDGNGVVVSAPIASGQVSLGKTGGCQFVINACAI